MPFDSQYLGSVDNGGFDAEAPVMNISISSLGRTSSASVTAAQPCSFGRFIITASQLLPLLPPPQPPSLCILPPLSPLPLSFQVSLRYLQPSSAQALLPPLALGHTSLLLTVSPLFPCLLHNPLYPSDLTALQLSLPPPLFNLVARHAATGREGQIVRFVVLLIGFDAEYAAAAEDAVAPDDTSSATLDAAQLVRYAFVRVAASSSEVDAVVVNCGYAHMHLLPLWQRMQMHVAFATIGSCSPPVASISHIPLAAKPSLPVVHRSIASRLLSSHTSLPFSPSSPTSRARIAALAYAVCNVSVVAAMHDGSRGRVELERTIACLERELMLSTRGLQLQCVNNTACLRSTL